MLAEALATVDFDQTVLHVTRNAWRTAVAQVATKAHEKLPECNGRVDSAVKMVLAGDVELRPDGTALVASQSSGTTEYLVVNGTCPCMDFAKAPRHLCKHRLGAAIAKRAHAVLALAEAGTPEVDDSLHANPEAPAHPSIAPEYVVLIKGRPYATYQGLLIAAQAQGLVTLEARFISVTDSLALAEATATFRDGRIYTEAGDATPSNVGAQVRPHFARLALTRAKCRALRDALGALCAVEELGE